MSSTATYSAEDFLAPESLQHADDAVTEIFAMMFGLEIKQADAAAPESPTAGQDEKTAIVGLSGIMRGSCRIRLSSRAAQAIASAMTGIPVDEDDESSNDAVGELCNMLAGSWKNSFPALSSACSLSPPTVICGHNYTVHLRKPFVQLWRNYQFDQHLLHLALHFEQSEAFPGSELADGHSDLTR